MRNEREPHIPPPAMTLLLIAAAWLLALSMVASVCMAARVGDRHALAVGVPAVEHTAAAAASTVAPEPRVARQAA